MYAIVVDYKKEPKSERNIVTDERGSLSKSGQMCCIEQAVTGVRSALPGELVVG
jgi:hypothetical protein